MRMLSTKVKIINIVFCSESRDTKVPSSNSNSTISIFLPVTPGEGHTVHDVRKAGEGMGGYYCATEQFLLSRKGSCTVPRETSDTHEHHKVQWPHSPQPLPPRSRVPQAAVHKLLSQKSSAELLLKAQRPRGELERK